MAGRPLITDAERRARLAVRHHLAPAARTGTVVAAAEDLVGLHASDPVSVYLAARARVRGFATADLERALYDERSLLKVLGMRRTMFVVPVELAAIIQAACTASLARGERGRLLRMLEEAGISDDPERWLAGVEDEAIAALERLGEATAADLTKAVEGLRAQIPFGAGKAWQGTVGVSTRLLFLLATEGRIIRGRPKGTLVSSLYRWVPMDRWVPGGLRDIPASEAQAELARRWLATFGPGTRDDLRWWAGWTVATVTRALRAARAVEVDIEGGATGWALPDDLEPVGFATPEEPAAGPPAPWVALLPALDPTTMGWQARDWYLGGHRGRLFDRNGNAGPTIWLDGRVVGGWAQRRDGEIAVRLLEDVGREASNRVAAEAAELQAWLGNLRFVPRFRTPLEQELIG
ncbi:MAG TPA: winged helix DNA-binding domain-containing protein [Candidatus Limnocylindrales bacterium]|nr:winged helix DNA-binding domain-containing protein [Candidatus Limnocylindrales bacterium]